MIRYQSISAAILSACMLFTSCTAQEQSQTYQAKDLTTEGLFTPGIEGPCTGPDGWIYIVNFAEQGTIGRVNTAGDAELFVTLPEGSIGNGIRMGKDGNLYIADYTGHNVLMLDLSTKEITVHAHNSAMNQPNDVAIASDGTLYASDPNWKEGTGQLWRIDTDGSTHLLAAEMGTTNGIELSPDEDLLYVNESVQRQIWVFDLSAEGEISNKRLLRDFPDFGFDGMRCDQVGNLYVTRHGKGTVVVLDPDGELIQEIKLTGTKPSNIAFGGTDGKTCFLTLQDRGAVETFRAEHPGRSFTMTTKK